MPAPRILPEAEEAAPKRMERALMMIEEIAAANETLPEKLAAVRWNRARGWQGLDVIRGNLRVQ